MVPVVAMGRRRRRVGVSVVGRRRVGRRAWGKDERKWLIELKKGFGVRYANRKSEGTHLSE